MKAQAVWHLVEYLKKVYKYIRVLFELILEKGNELKKFL